MNTRPIIDGRGRVHAVEIDMWYAGPRMLARLIGGVSGVSDVQVCRPFSRSGDLRMTFRFQGTDYVMIEPWGDSNEYWIGPANEVTEAPDLSSVDKCLRTYTPSIHRRIIGDLLTLNFKSLTRK